MKLFHLKPLLVGLAIAASGIASAEGVKEFKVGNTMPYSGPAAIYGVMGKVQSIYFNDLNAKGGVKGVKINFISRDDMYNPAKTVPEVRRLVENDHVDILLGSVGTAPILSVRDYLNRKKIPQISVLSGNSQLNDPKNHPYTVPGNPSYMSEGMAFGEYILNNIKDAKIAVLYQNDDYGKEVLIGLQNRLGDKAKSMIVATESYEVTSPTVDSQVINLKASGATVFVNVATPRAAAQAIKKTLELGWKPTQLLTYTSANKQFVFEPLGLENTKGIIAFLFLKEIDNPKYKDDADVKEYVEFMKKNIPHLEPENSLAVTGYFVAKSLVETLQRVEGDLTRENVLKAATNWSGSFPLMLPELKVVYTPSNYQGVSSFQPFQFDGKYWQPIGNPIVIK